MRVSVDIVKSLTGEVRRIDRGEYRGSVGDLLFSWTDGNFGCDCNRALMFDDSDVGCSDGEYLVRVSVDGVHVLDELAD